MRFKGKIAPWWYIVTALINGMSIGVLIHYGGYGPNTMYIPILIVLDSYLLPVYLSELCGD